MVTGVIGLAGVCAVPHVTVELKEELGHAIHRHHLTEDNIAMDQQQKVNLVTTFIVEVIFETLCLSTMLDQRHLILLTCS